MRKSTSVFILFWLGVLSFTSAQLKEKAIEKFDGLNQNIIIDPASGFTLNDGFLGSKSKRTATNSNDIPVQEKLTHIHGSMVFSQRNEADINSILKKYTLINNIPVEEKSLDFGALMITDFFESGSFVAMNDREEGSLSVRIYSSDLQLLKEYTPFKNGFQPAVYHIYKNHFVMVAAPAYENARSRLIAFNSKGEELFNKELDHTDANVQNVIAGDNYFAVYSFKSSTRTHEILVYDTKGSLLWRTNIDSMVQKWTFYEAGSPLLVIATVQKIFLFDINTRSLVDRKKLIELYHESNTTIIRPHSDEYIKVVDMKPLFNDQLLGVLITEQTSNSDFKNNLLYSFESRLNNHKQLTKLGDSKILPSLLNSNNDVLIIKDNEILKYGFEK